MKALPSVVVATILVAMFIVACGGAASGDPVGLLPIPTNQFAQDIPNVLATTVPDGVRFESPDGELPWDGPDQRVSSDRDGHCGPPEDVQEAYGIPAHINVQGERGYWYGQMVPRESAWQWTGYYHDDWQLWQHRESTIVYLVHPDESRIAFEYGVFLCI